MKHHTTIRYSGICGLIDTEDSHAACSCGWSTGWDNGWQFVTRLRVWWHQLVAVPGKEKGNGST